MSHLAIIIVSWNVRNLLRRCLQAIEASLAGSVITYEVVVVDNASSDGTPAMLHAEFPHVCLLEPGRNLGFVGGNNLALRVLDFENREPGIENRELRTRNQEQPTYVLLLNPDTEPLNDALPQLVRYLETHPDTVAVGPRLRYADGSIQSSRRCFPTRLTFFWESTPLERTWPGNPWARRYHCADQDADHEQPVDWLVGAALLVRGAAIARAGLLDERFFMYSEELEWQARLQGSGVRGPGPGIREQQVVYLPLAEIIHHEGRSSEQVPAVRHVQFQRSRLILAHMWYGAAFAGVLRGFLLTSYLWELLLESAKYALGHKRDLRRGRIRVYAVVLNEL